MPQPIIDNIPGDIDGVIFDLDGTLYNSKKMAMAMMWRILRYYVLRPHRLKDLWILFNFRRERECHSGVCGDLERMQYQWTAIRLHVSDQDVRQVVEKWIIREPLAYMRKFRQENVVTLLNELKHNGKKIAVVSEYPINDKMKALHLSVDAVICCVDADVDCFKPNPKGFLVASRRIGVPPNKCLVIGDRFDKDGEGAKRAGMLFRNVNWCNKDNLFYKTKSVILKIN
jgi:phosphoglycolate phosphatase/putative hydrolase of the HAD superfamily